MLKRVWERCWASGLVALAAISAAFTLLVFFSSPMRMSFGWDEAVYVSQISQHGPVMQWAAERARGMPLLIAPVTLLTGSVDVLRSYLAVLAGIGLFLALAAWRGLRPARVLVVAGVVFGGLWTVQLYAPLVFPNLWTAIGGLSSLGLFLRALQRTSRKVLVLLGIAVAFTGLMRPVDAMVLYVIMAAAALVKARPSSWLVIAVLGGGLAVALGEWTAEAFMYFDGIPARLHEASRAGGGTHFSLVNSLRILSGGNDSSMPVAHVHSAPGWNYPWMLLWWAAFAVFALTGTWLAHRLQGWTVAGLPLACGAGIYLLYSFPVRDNVRYLLATCALMAVPAADGIVWVCKETRGRARAVAVASVAAFLGVEILYGHTILAHQARGLEASAASDVNAAGMLIKAGVRPPCVVTSVPGPFSTISEPAAYDSGCSYQWGLRHLYQAKGRQVVILMYGNGLPWKYAISWRPDKLWGMHGLVAYVQDRGRTRS